MRETRVLLWGACCPFAPISERERLANGQESKDYKRILKIIVARNRNVCYTSYTFNENLLKHISHELADDAGRESDTS